MNTQTIINQCKVSGNTIYLPPVQLDRNLYLEVKTRLEKIGGKWNRSKQGFVFDYDPAGLLAELQNGRTRDIKKEFQFFETPEKVALELIALAELSYAAGPILEPSAGRGAIIKHIPHDLTVHYYELNALCDDALAAFPNAVNCGRDFLKADETRKYSRIIANPPFSKNQDIAHIRKMFALLENGGILVSVASSHWVSSANQTESAFRGWLRAVGAKVIELEAGAFKESGTEVATVIVKIRKN